jgi:hypothetical protein
VQDEADLVSEWLKGVEAAQALKAPHEEPAWASQQLGDKFQSIIKKAQELLKRPRPKPKKEKVQKVGLLMFFLYAHLIFFRFSFFVVCENT